MTFNPQEHMTILKGSGKQYLEAKWRLVWFREVHPGGQISTEMLSAEPLVFRAAVISNDGVILATGHGSARETKGAVWSGREIEKAETAAISRALAHAGFGTQFEPDESETSDLADSPVDAPAKAQKQTIEPEAAEERDYLISAVVQKRAKNGRDVYWQVEAEDGFSASTNKPKVIEVLGLNLASLVNEERVKIVGDFVAHAMLNGKFWNVTEINPDKIF